LPKFNEEEKLTVFGVVSTHTLFNQVVETAQSGDLSLKEVLRVVTANTAEALKLDNKGVIKEITQTLLVLSKDTFEIKHVFAKGQRMIENDELFLEGTFE